MEEFLTQNKHSTNYYQSVQQNYYNLARIRERDSVLNKMQQQYENYTNINSPKIAQQDYELNNNYEQDDINNLSDNVANQKNVSNPNNNSSPLSNILSNLNLSNLSSLLNGGNFSNVILNLLSKENNEIGNLVKLMQNPMIKNTFSKKHNSKPANTFGDSIETKNEIDNFEKIET